ncbi:MAG: tripartite tricarboxylate transporter substrate-binding protein [Thiofilum sp.]|uniref:Bug family tripartite tricarboxylate transporter substrate binding protein n=1 Tax=Thiofilum sp. TaxID=2212733 RepID=UPI0025F3C07D|nr:tripartite tricarboxylate transporter substrate-binding protein [Thiofilum sp.]MBK8451714.1 tripartite tricarboxylate transporter substrate binding protein [Thiofilum sp.]MBK8455304.1 tripartite tricarboxylate transporter substrate binding protein [Thiofilum sp.]
MKRLVLASVLALAYLNPFSAFAANPEKPECVAPAKPGGGFDLTCRIIQTGMLEAKTLETPMQVTFMPGGIGAVAYNLFNTTRTDDPNAVVAFSSGSLLNIATGKYGEWTEKDARWVAMAGTDYGAVIVKADSPYTDLKGLMEALKADPASVVVGAGGSVGSQDWMKAALLMKAAGADPKKMRYVAFDGGGESIAALLGGNIGVYTGDIAEMAAHLEAGTMRVLAVMHSERLGEPFDKVPTAKEQGYDVQWAIIRGYYMGKNVSDDAYNAWVELFKKSYESDAFNKTVKDKGLFKLNLAGKEMEEYVMQDVAKLRTIATEMGLLEAPK